jgi:tetrahydromethanopterin S-methyltransferase subunit E
VSVIVLSLLYRISKMGQNGRVNSKRHRVTKRPLTEGLLCTCLVTMRFVYISVLKLIVVTCITVRVKAENVCRHMLYETRHLSTYGLVFARNKQPVHWGRVERSNGPIENAEWGSRLWEGQVTFAIHSVKGLNLHRWTDHLVVSSLNDQQMLQFA